MTFILFAGLRRSFIACFILIASLFCSSSAQAGILISSTLPNGIVNQLYSFDLSSLVNSPGVTTASVTGLSGTLPSGLTFNNTNSSVIGTPSTAGTSSGLFTLTVQQNNSSGQTSRNLNFNILASASTGTNVLANTLSNGIIFTGGTLTNVNGSRLQQP